MKILLAYKPVDESNDVKRVTTPPGLLSVGAMLKENFFDVSVSNFSYATWQDIERKIKEIKPDIIGTTCYAFNRHAVFRLARLAKTINPNIKVIVGGRFSTSLPEKVMKHCEEIDIIVLGEGEKTTFELIEMLKRNGDLERVRGIVFRKGNELIKTEKQTDLDIEKIPIPSKFFKYNKVVSSRCSSGKIRVRKAQDLVKEFELLKRQGVGELELSDAFFMIDKQRVINFCNLLLKEHIHLMWSCVSKYELVSEEILSLMKKAGCYKINYKLNRANAEKTVKAAEITRKTGIQQHISLTLGEAIESEKTIQEFIDLVEKIKPQSVSVFYLKAYPGTEVYEKAKQEEELSDFQWFKHEEDIPEKYVYKFSERKEMLELGKERIWSIFKQHKNAWRFSEEKLKNNIEKCEFDVFSMNELGKIYAKKQDYETATKYFKNAVRTNRFFAGSFLNLGIAAEKTDKIKEAIEHYKKAIELNPQNSIAFKNLGNAYHKKENLPAAIKAYENAVLLNYPQKAQLNAIIDHLKSNL